MAAGILKLPDEVLLDIAEELSQSDHATLCKTSKRLRKVAEPFLYQKIHMRWDETSYNPPIDLLLRTILDRPELSLYVRSLKLVGRYYQGQTVARPTLLTVTAALPDDKLVAASNSVGASLSDIPNQIRSGNTDGFIAILVSKLKNLEYLYLDVNWTVDTHFLGCLLKASLRSRADEPADVEDDPHPEQPSLKALRRVFLITNEYEGSQTKIWPRDTSDGLGLFYLPRIEHLTLAIANPTTFSWPFKSAPNPSHLSSLELYRVRECYLGTVLSVLDGLRKLRYVWCYQPDIDVDVSQEVVNLDSIASAIVQRKNTLTDLEILARTTPAFAWGDHIDPEIRMTGSLVTLAQLYNLKRLTVPWTFLAGLDEAPSPGFIGSVLPSSVEEVDIHLGPGSFDDDFFYDWGNKSYLSCFRTELNSGAMAHCESLRKVELPGYTTRTGPSLEERSELRNLGDPFGISIHQGGSYADIQPHNLGDSM